MKLFLIEQNASDPSYGDTDSAVVAATDEDDSRRVMFEGKKDNAWFNPDQVAVTLIAKTTTCERGIILSHELPN